MKRRVFLFALMLALPISGCGFQLRGTSPLNFKTVYVEAPAGNALAGRVRTLLKIAGATVTVSPKEAEIILRLGAEKRTKTILSLTSSGTVAEYRLEMDQPYQVHTPDGKEKLPQIELKFIRDMTFDNSQYAAKSAEEDFLYKRMDEDAAQQILRHLRRITL